MGICKSCFEARKEVPETWEEKIKLWLMRTFCDKQLRDYRTDFYNQGIVQGHKLGFEAGCKATNEYNKVDEDIKRFEI